MRNVKRNILLTPGPATTTNSVKFSQVVPDICPREKDFGKLMQTISVELTRFVADTEYYTTVLFGGSGTAAVESVLSSVIGDESIVIINNGAYGKRMCEIADAYGMNFLEFKSSPHEAIDLTDLESFVHNCNRKIAYLAVVHHETTTGLLNDIKSIGKLCRKRQIDMIVDAMSSYATIPIRMMEMNISYLAASSNKNLQGMAGVSFVIANRNKMEGLRLKKPRNYYLNLFAQYKYFSETGQMRFTPPVQTLYALNRAIMEVKQEGIKERYARYAKSWETLIDGIATLGLKHIVDTKHHSKIVTSIIEPDCDGYDFDKMHDYLYSRGFTIYPGKLEELKTFRIAKIGDISYKDIRAFLILLEDYLKSIDFLRKADDR
ncbi:2-aminoethylphosphonate aminotransferase [Paenibacillus prosopidis]|uniref:2-aminoethylphosphonate--pyruvate transaminase n=1 Tax=Paenibacillus prosopidis TaxID=630520 RepID=A0A368W364_9BACL|nr:2-aminoethylphosphonate--pyruvate transaminase [Paenibacillus prosopidis]RCW46465.1 2-aminoethylphosphonate-pyruvate transaminase [Paenibacillus prosopidis]